MKNVIFHKIKFVAFLLFGLLISHNSDAQLLNKLKDKAIKTAGKRVEQRLEKETEKQVDKAIDSLENKIFDDEVQGASNSTGGRDYNINININDNTSGDSSQNLGALMGQWSQMMAANYNSSYTFSDKLVVEVDATDDNEEPQQMTQYIGDNALLIVMQNEEKTSLLSDYENKAMLIVNEKEMTGVAISMDFMDNAADSYGMNDDMFMNEERIAALQLDCKATGKTKSIAGYSCKNWVCENDSVKLSAWYTDEVLFDLEEKEWGKLSNMYSLNYAMQRIGGEAKGTALELEYYDKIKKATATFKLLELDRNVNYVFETTKYQFPYAGVKPE